MLSLKNFLFLISILFLFSVTSVTIVYSQEDVDLLFQKGVESFQLGELETSLSYFDRVLELEPNHVKALNNKGGILSALGNHEDSLPYFDKVLQIEPDYVDALANKGSALGSLEEFDEAMKYLDRVLEIEPNHVNALNNKASVLIDQEKFYDAIPYFYKVLQIDPGNELATKNLPLVKKAIGFNRVDGFTEFILRDSQGNLIGYFKSPYLLVLDHEIAQNFTDSWTVIREISFEGTNYEVIQKILTFEIESGTFIATMRISDRQDKIELIMAPTWGFPIHPGDKITKLYTIFRPIE